MDVIQRRYGSAQQQDSSDSWTLLQGALQKKEMPHAAEMCLRDDGMLG